MLREVGDRMLKSFAERKIRVKGDLSTIKVIILDALRKIGVPLIFSLRISTYDSLRLPHPPSSEIYKTLNKEIFIKDDDVIFIEFHEGDGIIEYGYIGPSTDLRLLDNLTKVLHTLIKSKGMEFEEIPEEKGVILFNPIDVPQLTGNFKNAISELVKPDVFNFLKRLKDYEKSVYLKDIDKIYPITREQLQSLIDKGLVVRDYLIICKVTGREILRFTSLEAVKEAERSGFKCSLCGNPLSEERVEEAIFIPADVKELLKDNKWAINYIIDALTTELNIPREKIFADQPENYLNVVVHLPIDTIVISILPDDFSTQSIYMLESYLEAYNSKTLISISDRPAQRLLKPYLSSRDIDVYPLSSLDRFVEVFKRALNDKLAKFLNTKFKDELEHVKINLWDVFKMKVLSLSQEKSPQTRSKEEIKA